MLTPSPFCPQIVVLNNWWVYIGNVTVEGDMVIIRQSINVRRWGTTAGLGQLAHTGKTASTKLDPAGTVRAPLSAVIHLIDCNPAAWPELATSHVGSSASAGAA